MPVTEKTVVIKTVDGEMETFVAHPVGDAEHPVVFIYMDAVGYREELRNFARRFAANGYFCVLPNLYYRAGGRAFDPREPWKEQDRILPLAHSLTNSKVMADTAAVLAWLARERQGGRRKGCVGYCMGGRMALAAVGTFPDDFVAAASLYGGRQVTPDADSPHRIAMRGSAELYLGYAETDRHIPDAEVAAIDAAFRGAGLSYRLERYPGTVHGFAFPERLCYHHEAAERSWQRILELFARKLQSAAV
jgi:carboxymethylenebutenolidase